MRVFRISPLARRHSHRSSKAASREPEISSHRTCDSCGGPRHRFEELPRAYVDLLGVSLGDGCISTHPRGVCRLRLPLDTAYPRIVDEAARAMRTVMPSSRVGKVLRSGCVEVSSYARVGPASSPSMPGEEASSAVELSAWQEGLVWAAPHL